MRGQEAMFGLRAATEVKYNARCQPEIETERYLSVIHEIDIE